MPILIADCLPCFWIPTGAQSAMLGFPSYYSSCFFAPFCCEIIFMLSRIRGIIAKKSQKWPNKIITIRQLRKMSLKFEKIQFQPRFWHLSATFYSIFFCFCVQNFNAHDAQRILACLFENMGNSNSNLP